MSSINDIENNLNSVKGRLRNHLENLDKAKTEITDVESSIQENFGSDINGQDAVTSLMQALYSLSSVDSMIAIIQAEIDEYIANIKK